MHVRADPALAADHALALDVGEGLDHGVLADLNPASMNVLAGSMIVTPLSMWPRTMRVRSAPIAAASACAEQPSAHRMLPRESALARADQLAALNSGR